MNFNDDMRRPKFKQPCQLNFFFLAGNCGDCPDEERKVIFFTWTDLTNNYWDNVGNAILTILSLLGWLPWAMLANLIDSDFTFY